jgi:hypothetical protein
LIIACIGDISKLQLYIWSSYGLLAEIKKIFSLSSPLFFEVYVSPNTRPRARQFNWALLNRFKFRREIFVSPNTRYNLIALNSF